MSSQVRKHQRGIIRNKCYKRDGNIKAFKEEWKHFKENLKNKKSLNKRKD